MCVCVCIPLCVYVFLCVCVCVCVCVYVCHYIIIVFGYISFLFHSGGVNIASIVQSLDIKDNFSHHRYGRDQKKFTFRNSNTHRFTQ